VGVFLILVFVGCVGYRVTPVDRQANLVRLNPRLWQRYQFLQMTGAQLEALQVVDEALLTADVAAIAQANEQARQLAATAAATPGPSECAPVRLALITAAEAYADAAIVFLNAQLNPQVDPYPALNLARSALTEAQRQWQALVP